MLKQTTKKMFTGNFQVVWVKTMAMVQQTVYTFNIYNDDDKLV